MPFPMKKPMSSKPVQDDLEMDLTSPHEEPDTDTDEDLMESLSSKDIFGAESDDVLGGGNPLEDALMEAGYNITPEQLTQIEAILKPKAPAAGGPMGLGAPGKPMPSPKSVGGAMPTGVKPGMLNK